MNAELKAPKRGEVKAPKRGDVVAEQVKRWITERNLHPGDKLPKEGELQTLFAVSKGTIRFPLGDPVPLALIGAIARTQAREAAEKAGSSTPAARRGAAAGAASAGGRPKRSVQPR